MHVKDIQTEHLASLTVDDERTANLQPISLSFDQVHPCELCEFSGTEKGHFNVESGFLSCDRKDH